MIYDEKTEATLRMAFANLLAPKYAGRFDALLDSGTARSHLKLVRALAHFDGFCDAWIYPWTHSYEDEALRVLKSLHIPNEAVVISESDDVDGTRLSLEDLLERIDGHGMGTLAVFDPQRFAFYQGEYADSTLLLVRPGTLERVDKAS